MTYEDRCRVRVRLEIAIAMLRQCPQPAVGFLLGRIHDLERVLIVFEAGEEEKFFAVVRENRASTYPAYPHWSNGVCQCEECRRITLTDAKPAGGTIVMDEADNPPSVDEVLAVKPERKETR